MKSREKNNYSFLVAGLHGSWPWGDLVTMVLANCNSRPGGLGRTSGGLDHDFDVKERKKRNFSKGTKGNFFFFLLTSQKGNKFNKEKKEKEKEPKNDIKECK